MGKLLVFLFTAGKLGKVAMTAGTMLLSIGVYAMLYGWRYAVGFVLLMFIHEMGHFIAAHQRGLGAGLPTFIPFVGAWTQMKEMPHNAETTAYVGIAGPLLGTMAAMACYFLARQYDSNLLLALCYSGLMLNLFNLIPMLPFDGGHITAVISPRIWLFGVPLLAGLFFYRPSPLLIIIGIMAIPHIRAAWSGKFAHDDAYYEVPKETRINYAVLYLGLVGFLAEMSYEVHQILEGAR
jgi:Zn-dependent protease